MVKQDWFRGFLELPNGIPSHDTFTDVFAKLSHKHFEASFRSRTKVIYEASPANTFSR
ncbi:MAG: transposase family protein [Mesoflavibacter sp.]|nr:transposase family protein [Mesoflavibacter sp.]